MENTAQASNTGTVSGLFPASPQEELLFRIQDLFPGLGNGAIMARVRGCVEAPPLQAALARLQLRHPKLRCRITRTGDGRRGFDVLEQPPPIPFEIRDYNEEPLPWNEESHRLLQEELNADTGPLARALVLRSRTQGVCEIILVAHHAIADGGSALRIIEDLLAFYAEAEKGGTAAPVASLPVVSASHARHDAGLKDRISVLLGLARQRIAKRRERWVTIPAAHPSEAARPCMARHLFTEQETAAMQEHCRRERTTIGGALFATAVSSLAEVVPDQAFRFRCRFPVNIRGSLEGPAGPVTNQDLGCFISRFEKIFSVERPLQFWDLARQVWRDIEVFVTSGGPQLFYNLAGHIRLKRLRLREAKRDTLMINFFGASRIRGQYGSLALEEFITTARTDGLGPSLHVWGVIIRGRLCAWFGASNVSRDVWQRFHQAAMDSLRGVASQVPTPGKK